MKKRMVMCLACLLALFLAGCGNTHEGEPVFSVENITSVTFYTPAAPEGLQVPQEELQEIAQWLGTFAVGKKAGEALIPGSNSITVRIEYADGVVTESGLSTVTIENTIYYMDFAEAPECYKELING